MKVTIIGIVLLLFSSQICIAQQNTAKDAEQEITRLSKQKWQWMADKNTDSLNLLFDEKSMFVHMGGSWGKT